MKILYITHLNGNPNAGLTYSVPAQVQAQSSIDDVKWVNFTDQNISDWSKYDYYIEYKTSEEKKCIPSLVNSMIDLVVFESFYHLSECRWANLFSSRGIPYVIVPRSALTSAAQKSKKLKKIICNMLFFNKFAQNASGIQYLTESEKDDSGNKWNNNSFIIPNGIINDQPQYRKKDKKTVQLTFIGRLDPYQKGIDLLVNGIILKKNLFIKSHCYLDLYGPDYEGDMEKILQLIKQHGLENYITIHKGVYGELKRKVLLETDVFVLTSRFEGLPMGLLEALSYGIPCLITKGANLKNEVENYKCGWTAENSEVSVAKALEDMIKDRQLYEEKGMHAKSLAMRFSWENIAQKTHDIYEKIIHEA